MATKYNKNSSFERMYYDGPAEIDKRIDAFENGEPLELNLDITKEDMNLILNAILNRNNFKYINREMMSDLEKIIKIQDPKKYNTNIPTGNMRLFLIDCMEYLKIRTKSYTLDKETFIVRLKERFAEIQRYKDVVEILDSDMFEFGVDEGDELREFLYNKLKRISDEYLMPVMLATVEQKSSGEFKSSEKMNSDLMYVMSKSADFIKRIKTTTDGDDMGFIISKSTSEDKCRKVMSVLKDISHPLKTGLKEMNMMIDGFYKKKLYVYTGIPNTGKTTTLSQFCADVRAYNRAKDVVLNHNKKGICIYYTMEDEQSAIVSRMVGMRGVMPPDPETASIEELTKAFMKAHNIDNPDSDEDIDIIIKFVTGGSKSTEDLRNYMSEIERMIPTDRDENGNLIYEGYEIVGVFLDYVKRIKPAASCSSEEHIVLKYVSDELRNIAIDFNCPVVTAAQLNRQGAEIIETALGRGHQDTAQSIGYAQIGSSFAIIENTDVLVIINSEFGNVSGQKYMSFKNAKMRYRPKHDVQYFASKITKMGGFECDIDRPTNIKDPKNAMFRKQFGTFESIAKAENLYKQEHGLETSTTDFNVNMVPINNVNNNELAGFPMGALNENPVADEKGVFGDSFSIVPANTKK